MKHYLFDITDEQGYLIASAAYECGSQQEAQEKAEGDAAGDRCELVDCWEADEGDNPLAGYYCPACGEALEEAHVCAEIDVLAQAAWNNYKAGVCPCGDAECGGIEWLLDGDDPFEMLEVDL